MDRAVYNFAGCREKLLFSLSIATAILLFTKGPSLFSHPSDPKTKRDSDTHTIPLGSIYSTGEQDGIQHLPARQTDAIAKILDAIFEKNAGMGASNIFMVSGKDISVAVAATRAVLIGGHRADIPADRQADSKDKLHWVAVYFGISGSGSRWVVRSVTQNASSIRVTYAKGVTEVSDIHQYFAWAPLGDLVHGDYRLELFDEDKNEVALMRRVTIAKN